MIEWLVLEIILPSRSILETGSLIALPSHPVAQLACQDFKKESLITMHFYHIFSLLLFKDLSEAQPWQEHWNSTFTSDVP